MGRGRRVREGLSQSHWGRIRHVATHHRRMETTDEDTILRRRSHRRLQMYLTPLRLGADSHHIQLSYDILGASIRRRAGTGGWGVRLASLTEERMEHRHCGLLQPLR